MTDLISKPRHRVLVVDDDVALRTALGLSLSRAGYEVGYAGDGKEAVSMHYRSPFDVIVTEIVMPEKDGLETLMELRRQPSPTRIIAMSKDGQVSAELCLRLAECLGAHCVLAKPFLPGQLVAAVRKVIGEV